MDIIESGDRISISEASRLGLPALVREAEAGNDCILTRDGKAVAVLMGMERYEEWQRRLDDLVDIAMMASRMMTAGPERHSLDEVLSRFGYTREGLTAFPG